MMPKLMFIGWKSPMLPWEIYSPSAPMAVSCEKSTGGSPKSRAAISSEASIPEAQDSTYPSTPVICPAKAIRGSAISR